MCNGDGLKINVIYLDGDNIRRIQGKLISEDDKFLTIDLQKYIVKIAIKHIFKIEYQKLIKSGRIDSEL